MKPNSALHLTRDFKWSAGFFQFTSKKHDFPLSNPYFFRLRRAKTSAFSSDLPIFGSQFTILAEFNLLLCSRLSIYYCGAGFQFTNFNLPFRNRDFNLPFRNRDFNLRFRIRDFNLPFRRKFQFTFSKSWFQFTKFQFTYFCFQKSVYLLIFDLPIQFTDFNLPIFNLPKLYFQKSVDLLINDLSISIYPNFI